VSSEGSGMNRRARSATVEPGRMRLRSGVDRSHRRAERCETFEALASTEPDAGGPAIS
jgi:hypothetical protein